MSYITPWTGDLETGTYTITVLDIVGNYVFKQWENGDTNPSRTINLTANTTIEAIYELPAPTTGNIEVHAYLGTTEVTAQGLIVETSQQFQTPKILEVPPGAYTVKVTYLDEEITISVNVISGQTARVEAVFTARYQLTVSSIPINTQFTITPT